MDTLNTYGVNFSLSNNEPLNVIQFKSILNTILNTEYQIYGKCIGKDKYHLSVIIDLENFKLLNFLQVVLIEINQCIQELFEDTKNIVGFQIGETNINIMYDFFTKKPMIHYKFELVQYTNIEYLVSEGNCNCNCLGENEQELIK